MALTAPSLSPAIIVREFDLTGVAPNVDTSLSGIVGKFKWGPVNDPVLIENEDGLSSTFGIPDDDIAVDYFSANQYLKYSGNLWVCRQITQGNVAVGDSALNSTISGVELQAMNEKHFEQQDIDEMFLAKYPGELGNSLSVKTFARPAGVSDVQYDQLWEDWDYADRFDEAPGTSVWAENLAGPIENDEIHIVVVDSDGGITGT
ncbi:MAG: hypothetical protein VW270_13110, partial [Candidatus Poseidoniales archaeon]